MSELTMERLRGNLKSLKMKKTLEIPDNHLERAVKDKLNTVEVLDYIFTEEAKSNRNGRMRSKCKCPVSRSERHWRTLISAFTPPSTSGRLTSRATMLFLENGKNIDFLDPPGVGKTHLALALRTVAARHRCSTYYINCHTLIEQLKKAHYENRLPDNLHVLGKSALSTHYEAVKASTIFTSNKTFSQ